ncbi:MAG: hypothetical protein ABR913_02750 [Sedimentisphaerales bacterium]|jgi:hypothetical protein
MKKHIGNLPNLRLTNAYGEIADSSTSVMKAAMNGVLNLSVPDGCRSQRR